jgi:DNA-binding MurR/RpiR family transcriptional regulator
VADHVLEHLRELPFHTADSLAEQVGVSRAGVIRLTQRLGYQGFGEIRDWARAELRHAESPLQRFHPKQNASVFAQKVSQGVGNLKLTQQLTTDLIPVAVRMLADAPKVYLSGNGKSHGVAIYLHHLLHGVRPAVHLLTPSFRQEVTDMTPQDVLLLCLFQRYSRESIKILSYAGAHNVPNIVITDGGGHGFLRDADIVLVAATDSSTLNRSMLGPILLIETLAAEVANAIPDVARQVLTAAENFNRGHEFLWK